MNILLVFSLSLIKFRPRPIHHPYFLTKMSTCISVRGCKILSFFSYQQCKLANNFQIYSHYLCLARQLWSRRKEFNLTFTVEFVHFPLDWRQGFLRNSADSLNCKGLKLLPLKVLNKVASEHLKLCSLRRKRISICKPLSNEQGANN
jgi:hypothetical protein